MRRQLLPTNRTIQNTQHITQQRQQLIPPQQRRTPQPQQLPQLLLQHIQQQRRHTRPHITLLLLRQRTT